MSPRPFAQLNDGHQQLLRELNAERAAALRRIAGKLEALIEQLNTARDRVAAATDAERPREIAAYRELRAHAVRYRWYLEVQREALGLLRHDRLDEFYVIPPPIDATV